MANAKKNDNGQYIYCAYIIKNGKVIYPKNAKAFRIPRNSLKPKGK